MSSSSWVRLKSAGNHSDVCFPSSPKPTCLQKVWTLHNLSAARRLLIWHSEYDLPWATMEEIIISIGNDGLWVQSLLITYAVQDLGDPQCRKRVALGPRWLWRAGDWIITDCRPSQTLRRHRAVQLKKPVNDHANRKISAFDFAK